MRSNNDWLDYLDARRTDVLEHSAKGTEWGKHKYIAKIGNRYFYSQEQLSAFKKTKTARKNYENAKESGASEEEVAKLKQQYDSNKVGYLKMRSKNKSGVLGSKAYEAKKKRQAQHVADVKKAQKKAFNTSQKLRSAETALKEARANKSSSNKAERQTLKKQVQSLRKKDAKVQQKYSNQLEKHSKVTQNMVKNYSQEERLALSRGDVSFAELKAAREKGNGAVTELLKKRDKQGIKAFGKAARNS